jgi:cell division protein FtsB
LPSPLREGALFTLEVSMKKELALRIVQLNEIISDQENEMRTLKETIKDLNERREGFLRELVMLVTEEG